MQYADDISKISSDYNNVQRFKHDIPKLLLTRNLTISQQKTEEYTINKNEPGWKKCKLLGTLLDTNEDFADENH